MSVIDEYLASVPEPQKKELERIRRIVKEVVPEAEEAISYQMPTFKFKGKNLIHFAAFKNHMSIFPTAGPTQQLKDKLEGFITSKGTIKFTLEKNVPESLIKEIVEIRIADLSGS